MLESSNSVLEAARFFRSTSSSLSSIHGALVFVYFDGVLCSISAGTWNVLRMCIVCFSHFCRVSPRRPRRRRGRSGSRFFPLLLSLLGVGFFVCMSVCLYVCLSVIG